MGMYQRETSVIQEEQYSYIYMSHYEVYPFRP